MKLLKHILREHGLEEGLKLLTPREQKVLELYYLTGYRDEEIAGFYDVCQQNINRQRKIGIKKLRNFKK